MNGLDEFPFGRCTDDKDAKKKLDEYQIIRMLGQGGCAQVKLAQHKESKQRVAIKIYQRSKLNDPRKKTAVQREIVCMQKLNHPHICKLYDFFETQKEIYLVMEYVSGISLFQYMRNKGSKPLNTQQARVFTR